MLEVKGFLFEMGWVGIGRDRRQLCERHGRGCRIGDGDGSGKETSCILTALDRWSDPTSCACCVGVRRSCWLSKHKAGRWYKYIVCFWDGHMGVGLDLETTMSLGGCEAGGG